MLKQCIKFDLEKNNIVADIIVKKGKLKTASYNCSQIFETNSSFHVK